MFPRHVPSHHHHPRVRRAKKWLRFLPRRAVFHRYPFIGRFAAIARQQLHIWSFRNGPVRRAFYSGSVLSLLPLMGVQLAVGLVLAILTRSNYMVVAALQFITNPFTAVPVYGATFLLGRSILHQLGFALRQAQLPEGWHELGLLNTIRQIEVGSAVGQGVICLCVGGVFAGLVLGALLDGAYLLARRSDSDSTVPPSPTE